MSNCLKKQLKLESDDEFGLNHVKKFRAKSFWGEKEEQKLQMFSK